MSDLTRACDVCGRPGFEIACLPLKCPQCEWIVENLPGEPREAYLRKLDNAKKEWQARERSCDRSIPVEELLGPVEELLGPVVELFEKIGTAWKAGRWDEVLGYFDRIIGIDQDNARASRERPLALFCLMESLLQQYSDTRRKVLQQKMAEDERSRDNLQAEARKFESVGMAEEADESLVKAAELDRRIRGCEAESKALSSLSGKPFSTRFQQGYPESLPRDLQVDAASLLSLPDPRWTDKRFDELLLQPFFRQVSALPAETRRYALEFQEACKKAVSEVRLREEKARKALDEARRMIGYGSFPTAKERLTEALTLDPSLSNEIGLVRSDLTKRWQAAKNHEDQQTLAAQARAEERRRNLSWAGRWVIRIGVVLTSLLILVWAWSNLIVPFFGHIIWQPFSWRWYSKLLLGLVTSGTGFALTHHGREEEKLPLVIIGILPMLYGIVLSVVMLGELLSSVALIAISVTIHAVRGTRLADRLSGKFGDGFPLYLVLALLSAMFVFLSSLLLTAIVNHQPDRAPPRVAQSARVILPPPVQYAVVNVRAANLRSGPSLSDEVVDVAYDGDTLSYMGFNGSWLRVRKEAGGSPAWVYSDLATLTEPVPSLAPIRMDPDASSEILYLARHGEEFSVFDSVGKWNRITDPDRGIAGWIDREMIDKDVPVVVSEDDPARNPDAGGMKYLQCSFIFGVVALFYSMIAREA